ncbi:MAG: hypothetical protein GKC53_00160 [Neisseriaceae bacterium]|nr:MAG: hypothetical protein GKC53_00160 [Neisseriaceae bacterium]
MNLKVKLNRSWIYLGLVNVLHLWALLCFFIYYQGGIRWLQIVLMLISYVYTLYVHHEKMFRALEIKPDNTVLLQNKNLDFITVNLKKISFKNKYFMIVQWQQKERRIIQLISRDMCREKEYHRLFVYLNWMMQEFIEEEKK